MTTLTEKLFLLNRCTSVSTDTDDPFLEVSQTLAHDLTGPQVLRSFERFSLNRVRTQISVQYVDHQLLQQDPRAQEAHLFLRQASQRWGIWYSRPGNGVSHAIHTQRFAVPGKLLLGADSHTCANGATAMLALAASPEAVAGAMAGQPYRMAPPKVFGVYLKGKLPRWVSAKDVGLELLRRHGAQGAQGYVLEYFGDGLRYLSIWDRHVIATMGVALGAVTSVFPADEVLRLFLRGEGRAADFVPLEPGTGARYDRLEEVRLETIEPLIAKPHSPGDVVRVRDVAGEPIYQAYIGSGANPGFRDFAIAAQMVEARAVPTTVSFDINPTSARMLRDLANTGLLAKLLDAGARVHQAGCNGCFGSGQVPAAGRNSLRTVASNEAGASGSIEDRVWLCSPETATASALRGQITDPRDLRLRYPEIPEPQSLPVLDAGFLRPSAELNAARLGRERRWRCAAHSV